jgi:hypothetical protein
MTNDAAPIDPGTRPPGAAERLRPALVMGLYIGSLLIIVMVGALLLANRMPRLERYAFERNAASYGTFVILMLIPILVFLKHPLQMFLSAIVAWVLFVAAYNVTGLYFRNLFDVLRTPFVALIEGGVVYGVAAVLCWVAEMAFHARHHAMAPRRRRAQDHGLVRHHR